MPVKERRRKEAGSVWLCFRAQYQSAGGNRRRLGRIAAGSGKAYMKVDFLSRMHGFGRYGAQAAGADVPGNGIELKWFPAFIDAAYNDG